MKKETKKSSNRCLAAALASLIAVSAMITSVMTGCGTAENTGATKIEHETQIVSQVVTDVETVTKAVNNKDNSDSNDNTNKTSSTSESEKTENSSDSSANTDSSNKTSSDNSSSSKNTSSLSNNNSSSKPADSSNSKPNSSSNNGDSTVLTIDGNKFNVGDTITCTYKLKSPDVLENFQASVGYNAKYLKVTKAALVGDAKSSSIVNYKVSGKVNVNGSNISDGYDYKKAAKFLTITYTVISGGSTTTNFEWVAACQFGANPTKNYVADDGTPASGLKIAKSYAKN